MMQMSNEKYRRRKAAERFDAGCPCDGKRLYGIERCETGSLEGEALRRRLAQAQKMEAVGALAGGMVHELNNVLMSIRGYAELMRSKLDSEDPLRRYLVSIDSICDRAASMARNVLDFSRPGISEKSVLDINRIIRETEELLRQVLPSRTRLDLQLAENLSPFSLDSGQVKQAIINLVLNARDAMDGGGVIRIRSSLGRAGHPLFLPPPGANPIGCVEVVVEDSGKGIAPEAKSRIFEPFFTTKEKGKGTGLGLFIVKMVLENHGGAVVVESEEGKGSRFRLLFPQRSYCALPL